MERSKGSRENKLENLEVYLGNITENRNDLKRSSVVKVSRVIDSSEDYVTDCVCSRFIVKLYFCEITIKKNVGYLKILKFIIKLDIKLDINY